MFRPPPIAQPQPFMTAPIPTPLQQPEEERVPSRKQSIEISHQEETKIITTPQVNILERSMTETARIEHEISREEAEQSSIDHSQTHIPEIQASLEDGEGGSKMPKKKKKAKKAKKKLTAEEEQAEHNLVPDREEIREQAVNNQQPFERSASRKASEHIEPPPVIS